MLVGDLSLVRPLFPPDGYLTGIVVDRNESLFTCLTQSNSAARTWSLTFIDSSPTWVSLAKRKQHAAESALAQLAGAIASAPRAQRGRTMNLWGCVVACAATAFSIAAGASVFTTFALGTLPEDIVVVPAGFGSFGGSYFVNNASR